MIYHHTSYFRVLPFIVHHSNLCFSCVNEPMFATIREVDVSKINPASIFFFLVCARNLVETGIS